jgi:hypothetical protein
VRLSMSKRLVTKIFRPFRYPYPAFSSGTIAGILVSGLAGSFILVSRLVGIGRGSPSSSRDIVGDDVLSLYLICDPGRSELESGWQGHLIFFVGRCSRTPVYSDHNRYHSNSYRVTIS